MLINNQTQFHLFTDDNQQVRVSVRIEGETIWLSQKSIAELFNTSLENIILHLKNIYNDQELTPQSTTKDFLGVQIEGNREVKRSIKHYNLDAIIAVGYRVNSKRATQFRIWATNILKEYIKKGFVLDDERLKQGQKLFDKDYFRELLERVR